LLRYCAADVLMLYALAHRLTGRHCQEPWAHLPSASTPDVRNLPLSAPHGQLGTFGWASPRILRGRAHIV
jgi:hypothetical protein